ncbi:hypothetical protein [Butyrivibrio sp. YAB3001]|uniref:hypothetical protein n=1 Tax=Butyrivibrio sp. YAB3001 TaxID=1520812 RepID=UPI0008F656EF|nr:hypothetical protein [Butyrivibrio sp. YAB3001]SFD02618.1 hypothetical protein SAMN02910398_03822 [Butyrivibrio sp. YAB3001]
MENDNRIEVKIKILYALLFVLTGVLICSFSIFTKKSYEEVLRNTIVSLIITGNVVFMLVDAISRGEKGLSFDNYHHKGRFVFVYAFFLVLSCFFSLVPNEMWPYMSLFIILALFSNHEIGMASGTGLLIISIMLEANGNIGEFFMYCIAGMVALSMFRDLKENTAIGNPTAISLMMQAVLLMAFNILFLNRTLSVGIFMLPVFNLMLNLVILLIFLNMFGVYVIRKSNDMYMEINDAGFTLFMQLKEKSKDEYYRSIHTGYLAERIANGLHYNERAVKACAYYNRIGILEGKNGWDEVKHFYIDNNFPVEAVKLLHEYIDPKTVSIRSKEALSVVLSETVIESIMYLINQDKNAKIDYDRLIDGIMDKKIENNELKAYDVTFREYDKMRQILKKEKLYYDFLR